MDPSADRSSPRRRWPVSAASLGSLALLLTCGPTRAEDATVAMVNGQPLSGTTVAARLAERYGYLFVESAILEQVILQAAERAGLAPGEGDLAVELDRFLGEHFNYSDERYQRWLKEFGHTEAGLRAEIRVQVAQLKLRTQGVPLGLEVLKQYYQEHQAEYQRPESVIFRQIIVPASGQRVDGAYPDSRTKGLELLQRIRAGTAFEEVARSESEDPNAAATGGRVGPVTVAVLQGQSASIHQALAGLAEGQVAPEPVLYGNRYLLLQLVQRLPALSGSFDALRRRIEIDYLAEKMQPQREFLMGLLKGAAIDLRDPRFRGLKLTGRWVSSVGLALPGWLRDDR